jgi:Flp pilus assembly protein TadG
VVRDLRHGDDGNAVVEFVLVGVLLVFLILAVLQVGIVLHLRNVAVAAFADAARYAANADRDCADGEEKAREIVAASLSRAEVRDLTCRTEVVGGLAVVRVEARVSLPLLVLPIAPADVTITARGRAVEES